MNPVSKRCLVSSSWAETNTSRFLTNHWLLLIHSFILSEDLRYMWNLQMIQLCSSTWWICSSQQTFKIRDFSHNTNMIFPFTKRTHTNFTTQIMSHSLTAVCVRVCVCVCVRVFLNNSTGSAHTHTHSCISWSAVCVCFVRTDGVCCIVSLNSLNNPKLFHADSWGCLVTVDFWD